MNISYLLFIGLGGAAGAVSRYLAVALVTNVAGDRFPWGTLVVNVVGSFCLGAAFVLVLERLGGHQELKSLIMVGFLGAFTTFSTFSLETVSMLHAGHYLNAIAYVAMSVILCLLATMAAIALTRAII